MDKHKEIIRTTVEIPSALWANVRVEKIQKGDESLNDVVIRALKFYFGPFGPKREAN